MFAQLQAKRTCSRTTPLAMLPWVSCLFYSTVILVIMLLHRGLSRLPLMPEYVHTTPSEKQQKRSATRERFCTEFHSQ